MKKFCRLFIYKYVLYYLQSNLKTLLDGEMTTLKKIYPGKIVFPLQYWRQSLAFLISIITFSLNCVAQRSPMDSLMNIIIQNRGDSTTVNALLRIAGTPSGQKDSMAIHYAEKAYMLAERIQYKRGIAAALIAIGKIEDDFKNSFAALAKAVDILGKIGDPKGIADCYALIANKYFYQEFNAAEAINYALKAIAVLEKNNDIKGQAPMLMLIGNAYIELGNEEKALESLIKSKEAYLLLNDRAGLAYSYNNIGLVYAGKRQYGYAYEQHCQALTIYRKLDTLAPAFGIAYTLGLIGSVQQNMGDSALDAANPQEALKRFDSALYYFREQYKMETQRNASHRISSISLARSFLSLARLKSPAERKELLNKSYRYINEALTIAESEGFTPGRTNAYSVLHEVDELSGNYKAAYDHYRLYVSYKDSLVTQENIDNANSYKTQYEYGKKEDQIKLLATENELKTALAQKENQRKNFALAGIGIIILIGGYGFYWFRKKKRLQNEQTLMTERLRISRELHDEVGATLSGVAMYSHLTKTQLQSQDLAGVENSLNIMQDSSAQMVNKLNDIVWLINPVKSSLADLMQRLEEYTRNMAAAKNMEVEVNITGVVQQLQLNMEQRRNIYLFCKEAINNAAKYSGGTMLGLSVREEEKILKFSIKDNGNGFDPEVVKRGNGSDNLQQRADAIGAEYILHTSEGKGCEVSLQLKIT